MTLMEKHGISSLAAPTEADLAKLRSLSDEERRALIAEHIELGTKDIAEGRFTLLDSDEAIEAFFDEIWSLDEAPVV